MKKISQTTLTLSQKKEVTHYTQTLLGDIFTKKIESKEQLLQNVIEYTRNNSCSEGILTQTLLKGCFPFITWTKLLMLKQANVSTKITASYKKETSDVRFITELNTVNRLVEQTRTIQSVVFNSENPKMAAVTASHGNKFKDITLNITIENNKFNIISDIKSGDNVNHIFKGLVGNIPIKKDFEPYGVFNKPFDLNTLQKKRIFILQQDHNYLLDQTLTKIIEYTRSPLDPITINNLIQEELLKCVMLNILSKQPTLFAIQKITAKDFTTKSFAKLEPFITPNIFDNKICFNSFMANAIAIYIKEVNHEIVDHVNSNFWADSGFDIIAKNANELL